ncbi:hypothetical protein FISHEDRAFT_78300 [Fistulina hepatica ATCC 64428]|nr:hypothetical protein FISHEDRAFT_78300 [Fistulina hepatica ATCC 64428]
MRADTNEPNLLRAIVPATETFNIVLPDIPESGIEPPVQIPVVPNIWASGDLSAAQATEPQTLEMPKLLIVADISSHEGGVTHNTVDEEGFIAPAHGFGPIQDSPPSATDAEGGLWADVQQDLREAGIPPLDEIRKNWSRHSFGIEILQDHESEVVWSVERHGRVSVSFQVPVLPLFDCNRRTLAHMPQRVL